MRPWVHAAERIVRLSPDPPGRTPRPRSGARGQWAVLRYRVKSRCRRLTEYTPKNAVRVLLFNIISYLSRRRFNPGPVYVPIVFADSSSQTPAKGNPVSGLVEEGND